MTSNSTKGSINEFTFQNLLYNIQTWLPTIPPLPIISTLRESFHHRVSGVIYNRNCISHHSISLAIHCPASIVTLNRFTQGVVNSLLMALRITSPNISSSLNRDVLAHFLLENSPRLSHSILVMPLMIIVHWHSLCGFVIQTQEGPLFKDFPRGIDDISGHVTFLADLINFVRNLINTPTRYFWNNMLNGFDSQRLGSI